MSQVPMEYRLVTKRKVIVYTHPDLQGVSGIDSFVDEFIAYKSLAFRYAEENSLEPTEFIPALSEADQKEFPPDHELFGRDRLFTRGWLQYRRQRGQMDRAANDALYHVHIYDPNDDKCIWHDDGGTREVNQWYCTSDSALVYSYIDDYSGNFTFLLLAIVAPGAHDSYSDEQVSAWRRKADTYWTANGYRR